MKARSKILVYLLALLIGSLLAWPAGSADSGFVAQIDIDSAIGPATAEYFHSASQQAIEAGASAIVLRLDTPGGLTTSMRNIIDDILAAPIPVLGWVGPKGARAASAGTYILYATHLAAMAPATHLGAATPIALGGGSPLPGFGPDDTEKDGTKDGKKPLSAEHEKAANDAVAYIRSLAQLRDRNGDWAAKAVTEAATLTASEALSEKVIEIVASSREDLLRQADGRTVELDGQEHTLALAGLPVRAYEPDWRARFLGAITNPAIAYMLLMAGIWGLLLEAFHPGAIWPGTAGVICLLAGLYALHLFPINYIGFALMLVGILLLASEFFIPSYGILAIGGTAAFVLGSIMLLDVDVPGYEISLGIIGGIAFIGIAALAIVLWLVVHAVRTRVITGSQQMAHANGTLLAAIEAGGTSWARIYGERWQVRSDTALPAGATIHVIEREGLVLKIEPAPPASPSTQGEP